MITDPILKRTHQQPYDTEEEKAFLRQLGNRRDKDIFVKNNRVDLLRNYISAAKIREKWGNLDSNEIIAYAEYLLDSECK